MGNATKILLTKPFLTNLKMSGLKKCTLLCSNLTITIILNIRTFYTSYIQTFYRIASNYTVAVDIFGLAVTEAVGIDLSGNTGSVKYDFN